METAIDFLTTESGSLCWYEGNRELTDKEIAAIKYFEERYDGGYSVGVKSVSMRYEDGMDDKKGTSKKPTILDKIRSLFK